jgi:hypothetical protein
MGFRVGSVGGKGDSDLVQIWLRLGPGGKRRFRFGSGLVRLGAQVVQIWFRFGSAGGKGRSDLVQIWFRLGPSTEWARIRFTVLGRLAPSLARWLRIGSRILLMVGVCWVQRYFRFVPGLLQISFRVGSSFKLGQLWHRESLATRNLSPSVIGKVHPPRHACMITHAATHIHRHMPKCRLRTHLHSSTHTNTFARVVLTVIAG